MKQVFLLILCLLTLSATAGSRKRTFLHTHRQDMREDFRLPTKGVYIWGFGALHGSAKTEEVELLLLENLLKYQDTILYFPETDFSTAHYFQRYLDTGDETLLRDVVEQYGARIPQERAAEVFEKWKKLKKLCTGKSIRVIGTDPIASPKYALVYLSELIADSAWHYRPIFRNFLQHPENYSRTELNKTVRKFLEDCAADTVYYKKNITDSSAWSIVTNNLQTNIGPSKRESEIFANYLRLDSLYDFRRYPQFVRMGVFHIYKGREDDYPSFFARLIENGTYLKSEIYTIQGFLTASRVLWDTKYDDDGHYTGYTTQGGFGTSDCWREHFRGIRHLKRCRLSDMTLFDLRQPDSPYTERGKLELIRLRKPFGKKYTYPENASTLDYIDAAVLIRSSESNLPIEETDK